MTYVFNQLHTYQFIIINMNKTHYQHLAKSEKIQCIHN